MMRYAIAAFIITAALLIAARLIDNQATLDALAVIFEAAE